MHFEDSIRGLNPGAPVEFRGVRLGRVKDISLVYDAETSTISLPVLVELELERISRGISNEQSSLKLLQELVQQGLRARLETGNLLTGQLFIAMDMQSDAPAAELKLGEGYPEVPTVDSKLGQITNRATAIMQKIEQLPFDQLLETARTLLADVSGWVQASDTQKIPGSVNKTLANIQQLSNSLDKQINQTAARLQGTLSSGNELLSSVGPDSALQYELTRTLRELTRVAQQLRDLVQQLEEDPSSVLFGR